MTTPRMRDIPFTQFMLPNGRQVSTHISVPDDEYAKWEQIRDAGCKMTSEVLQNGIVSLAIEHPEADYDIQLCENKPGKPAEAVRNLLLRFSPEKFTKWLKAMKEANEPDATDGR